MLNTGIPSAAPAGMRRLLGDVILPSPPWTAACPMQRIAPNVLLHSVAGELAPLCALDRPLQRLPHPRCWIYLIN